MNNDNDDDSAHSYSSLCFRLDVAPYFLQLLLSDDGIVTFGTLDVRTFLASVLLIPFAAFYGIFALIGLQGGLLDYFNSNLGFRYLIILSAILVPFVGYLPVLVGRKRIGKMKTSGEILSFVKKKRRRGTKAKGWDEVEAAVLTGNTLILYLTNDKDGAGYRRAKLRQVYYPTSTYAPGSPAAWASSWDSAISGSLSRSLLIISEIRRATAN
jgi:hypothetical protein